MDKIIAHAADIAWTSSQQNDNDNDGCRDSSEDFDDDDDQICDENSTDGICEISSTLKMNALVVP